MNENDFNLLKNLIEKKNKNIVNYDTALNLLQIKKLISF